MKALFSMKWNLMRWIRLIIGLWALVVAWQENVLILAIAGLALVLMAFFNLGCLGAGQCQVPLKETESQRVAKEGNQPSSNPSSQSRLADSSS